MTKGLFALATAVCITLGAGSAAWAQDYTIRFAHSLSTNEPFHEAAEWFAAQVQEKTDGRVRVTVYPGEQLGANRDVLELVRQGANIISLVDSGYFVDRIPDFGILQGPYLLKSPEDYDKILSSEWYASLHEEARAAGFEVLASNWFFGERHIIANKPIRTLEDFNGLSIRVPPVPMFIETFQSLGTRPVTLEWSEVYTGLSQNVVDAAEAPLPTIYGSRLHETREYLSLTQHFTGYLNIAVGSDYFASLPEDIQAVLYDTARAAGAYMTEATRRRQAELVEQFRSEGVTVIDGVDIGSFAEATAAVYDKFPTWTPGLYATIRSILE